MKHIAGLVVALACAAPAAAQSLRDTHLYPGDGSGCFLRQYARDHLAKHPAQMVSMIAIGRTDYVPMDPRQPMRLMVMFRTGDHATVSATCQDGGPGLVCWTEGDGGEFTLEGRANGAVVLRPRGRGLVLEGAEEFHMLSATDGDDREFLMPPVPPDACP